MLGKTPESPLGSKEIKPVNPKGNQHQIFIGRIDAEAEAPILWLPDAKSQLTGKVSCWEKVRRRRREEEGRRRRADRDEMIGWYYGLNGDEFEQILGDSEGKGSLSCCSSWGRKKLDTT